jgi:glucose-6-phosphate isomerase
MTAVAAPLPSRASWKALAAHHERIGNRHLRTLFADDPKRGERLAVEAAGLYLDYSKNRVTDETLGLLVRLAEESGLRARTEAMFRGDKINVTEDRAVLHVALRAPRGASIVVDGERKSAARWCPARPSRPDWSESNGKRVTLDGSVVTYPISGA